MAWFIKVLNRIFNPQQFVGSARYWEIRYKEGGNSGSGSYNNLAKYKADFLNNWIEKYAINSVQEFGCGDGNQAGLIKCKSYFGWDVSVTAVKICQHKFQSYPNYNFKLLQPNGAIERCELNLSLDVIYHLIEDNIYLEHLHLLFEYAERYVIVYSCNFDAPPTANHVKPRNFSRDVERLYKNWKLIYTEKNPYPMTQVNDASASWSDFFVYEKIMSL